MLRINSITHKEDEFLSVRVAVIQTKTLLGTSAEKNIDRALSYIDQAKEKDAQIICFPETYPGPWRVPLLFSPIEPLCSSAKEKQVYIIAGTIEKAGGGTEHEGYYNTEILIGPDGKILGKYRRTTPFGPWIYKGGPFWDFEYLQADELPVFDTKLGRIGILICSEVYMPELSRVLALKGAEIVFLPAGVSKTELWTTWRTLIFARAIENLMYTATCQNLLGVEDGLAMISSPEEILVESKREGVFVENLDLERIRWLRETQDKSEYPRRWKTKPGTIKYWRRPDLYRKSSPIW